MLWFFDMCLCSSFGCLLMNEVLMFFVMKVLFLRSVCRKGMLVEMLWMWNFVRVWCVCVMVVGKFFLW